MLAGRPSTAEALLAQLFAGAALEAAGENAQARARYEKALALDPRSRVAEMASVRLLARVAPPSEARAQMARLIGRTDEAEPAEEPWWRTRSRLRRGRRVRGADGPPAGRGAPLILASFALAAALASDGAAQAPPVFAAQAESVYLDVFVTRDGEAVRGLTADDFEVLDGGRVVPVELVPTDAVPISAILVLDTSLSVAGGTLDQLRQACTAFVRALAPGDEAMLLTFSNAVRLRSAAGEDRAALEKALAETRAGGRTALFDAVFSGLLMAPSLPGRPALIVFSDGIDTVSWTGAADSLALARQSSTLVYAVGVASDLLQEVVSATGGRTLSEWGRVSAAPSSACSTISATATSCVSIRARPLPAGGPWR